MMTDNTRHPSLEFDPHRGSGGASGRHGPYQEDPLAELARLVAQDDRYRGDRRTEPGFMSGMDLSADGDDERYDEQGYPEQAYAPSDEDDSGEIPDLSSLGPDYSSDGRMPPHGSEFRSELRSRRNGLMTVGVVLGIAVLGTAGALAYRAVGASPAEGGDLPVIKATAEPVKVTPENKGGADVPHQNKLIYDRVGSEKSASAKVVGGPEEPVERPPAAQRDASRVMLPGSPPDANGGDSVETGLAASAYAPAPAPTIPAQTTTGQGDSRRVRTFLIRPDGSVAPAGAPAATQRANAAGPQLASAGPAAGQPIVGTGVANGMAMVPGRSFGIMSDEPDAPAQAGGASKGSVPLPAARPAAARPGPAEEPVRTASTTPTAPSAAPVAGAARPVIAPPLITGQPLADTRPPAAPPARVAAATATAPAAQAASASAARGGFAVQVTSQRSDADARTAFTNLQRRYPAVLGGHSPSIQQVAIGDKGTFYRARVGPFASRDEAATLCANLKSAGGECIVQGN